jgi:hypothetical protein
MMPSMLDVVAVSDIFPGPGSVGGDAIAVIIGIAAFALLFWMISLLDRV